MSELSPPGGVADREDPAVGGQEGPVGPDAVTIMGDAGGFQIEPLQRGGPAHGDEKVRSGDSDLVVP